MGTAFTIFVQLFAILKMTVAYEISEPGGKSMEMNGTTKIFTVDGVLPVVLFMEEDSPVQIFNFSVECKDKNRKYVIKMFSEDYALVNFQTDDVVIDCRNSTFEKVLSEPISNISNRDPSYTLKTKERLIARETKSLNVKADMIGRTFITFKLYNQTDGQSDEDLVEQIKFPVLIFRKLRLVDHLFQVFIYVFLIFTTLAFGCKLDFEIVKENLKRPIAPGIGLAGQFIIMPLLGYGIAKLVVPDRPDVALGIFVCGCCPGGGPSNIYSYLLGGELSLSITMTAVSTVFSMGTMPLWLYTLGKEFTDDTVSIPFMRIFTTLLVLILPLFVGIFIKRKLPRVLKIIMKIIKPITVICIIFLLTVGIYSNLYIFKLFNPKIVLAGCLLPYCGYILGIVMGLIAQLPWERVKTVGIETGMQNVGIAMVLMLFAFPPPDGYIAAVAPIASAVMTPLPLFLLTIIYLIYKRCNKEKYENVPNEAEKTNEEKKKKKDKKMKNYLGNMTLEVENGKITVI